MKKITLSHIPILSDSKENLEAFSFSAQEGFILSRIDGNSSIEKLQSMTGIHIRDLVRILSKLSDSNVIQFVSAEELSENSKKTKINN